MRHVLAVIVSLTLASACSEVVDRTAPWTSQVCNDGPGGAYCDVFTNLGTFGVHTSCLPHHRSVRCCNDLNGRETGCTYYGESK